MIIRCCLGLLAWLAWSQFVVAQHLSEDAPQSANSTLGVSFGGNWLHPPQPDETVILSQPIPSEAGTRAAPLALSFAYTRRQNRLVMGLSVGQGPDAVISLGPEGEREMTHLTLASGYTFGQMQVYATLGAARRSVHAARQQKGHAGFGVTHRFAEGLTVGGEVLRIENNGGTAGLATERGLSLRLLGGLRF